MSEVEVDTDDCSTAVSGTFPMSEVAVTFADISSFCDSTYSLDSTLNSTLNSTIPSLSSSQLRSVSKKFTSEDESESSLSSLSELSTSAFEHSSISDIEEEVNGKLKELSSDISSMESIYEEFGPKPSLSEIVTGFDDDYSYELEPSFVESNSENSGMETALEYKEDDQVWFLDTAYENTDLIASENDLSTCLGVSEIRL
ncbi:unnamed protein product [Bursaphelenchus okinawaensis]|uniref:Uncharacterized protein n=1 Tax=Bursaphelenchus okinawaensis TaxID=465554 RepID=A0A811L5Z7_9BILA|nr:unnamed protein product [Bursaphelenchus okinawaensis]CAG9116749.1 unnamed protein product [Bursaphelenchus okinawaensis]